MFVRRRRRRGVGEAPDVVIDLGASESGNRNTLDFTYYLASILGVDEQGKLNAPEPSSDASGGGAPKPALHWLDKYRMPLLLGAATLVVLSAMRGRR